MTALTPGEALVLMDPDGAPGMDALKVTVLALLAQGYLRHGTESRSSLFGRRSSPALLPGKPYPPPAPRHVADVLGVVTAAKDHAMPKLAEQFIRTFGAKCDGFTRDRVVPVLVGKGMLEQREFTERKRFLGLIPRTVTRIRHVPTASGAAEAGRIRQAVEAARDIPRFLSSDPARAVAMAAALGGLVFLVAELYPFMDHLSAEMQRAMTGRDSSDSSVEMESGGSGTAAGVFDLSAIAEMDGAFSELSDSLDSAMDAADSSSGGDSGGDGGGDGGGGGE